MNYTSEQMHDYYVANREAILAKNANYRAAHQAEIRAQKKVWYAANRVEIRARQTARHGVTYSERARKRSYGMEPGDYDRMLAAQGGVCAGCGTDDPGVAERCSKGFHVDHDHATGKVRGLLCGLCNRALGHAKDSPDRLMALAAYLLQHSDVLGAMSGLEGLR